MSKTMIFCDIASERVVVQDVALQDHDVAPGLGFRQAFGPDGSD